MKTRRHHTPKIMSTSESQNISPEVDFRKSKCITGSQLPEVKNYHRKSTSGSPKIFLEVDFSKSKNIPGSQKKFSESWLP